MAQEKGVCPYNEGLRDFASLTTGGVRASVMEEIEFLRAVSPESFRELLSPRQPDVRFSGAEAPIKATHQLVIRYRALVAICIEDLFREIEPERLADSSGQKPTPTRSDYVKIYTSISDEVELQLKSLHHITPTFYTAASVIKSIIEGGKDESVEEDIMSGLKAGLMIILGVIELTVRKFDQLPKSEQDESLLRDSISVKNIYPLLSVWAMSMGAIVSQFELAVSLPHDFRFSENYFDLVKKDGEYRLILNHAGIQALEKIREKAFESPAMQRGIIPQFKCPALSAILDEETVIQYLCEWVCKKVHQEILSKRTT